METRGPGKSNRCHANGLVGWKSAGCVFRVEFIGSVQSRVLEDALYLWPQNIAMLGSLAALLGFFTGYFSGFGAWYSELFPTSIRSTASGFCFNFGRVGAIAGIKLVPVLIPIIGFAATISMASAGYFLAAIMVFTLRETKGTQLTSGN